MPSASNDNPRPTDPRLEKALADVLVGLPQLLSRLGGRLYQLNGGFDELVQEVAVSAKDGLSKFTPGTDLHDSLRAWVFTIAKHRFVDMQTRTARAVETIHSDILKQAANDGLTPSRLAGREEGFELLHECLLKLDPLDRQLLFRRVLDQRNRKTVAQEFAMTTDALDRRLRRILRELRECWGSSGAYRFVLGAKA